MEGLLGNLWWLLVWAVLGLLAGAIAKYLMPGKDGGGYIATILLGVAGAIVGGYLAALFNFGQGGIGFFLTLVFAVVGSLVLLLVYRLVTGRKISG